MTSGRKQRLLGMAAPVLPGEPLVIRFCRAFTDNLALLLRGAFILGALLLVQEFDRLTAGLAPSAADVDPIPQPPTAAIEPLAAAEPELPVLTDRVRHYLNCTYEEYRRQNYAECVEEPSGIYRGPEAAPDDTGSLLRPLPVRYAYRPASADPIRPAVVCDDQPACALLL